MLGKMARMADGFVGGVSQFGQDLRYSKVINKGLKQPKANTSANADGFFSKGLSKVQNSTIGNKLTANTGYKIKKEMLTDDSIDNIAASKLAFGQEASNLSEKMVGLEGDELASLTKQRDAILGKSQRMDDMLKDGAFYRENTLKEYASDYFNDEVYGGFRKKAAIGTGAALGTGMVAGRLLTGGSLTRNGDGDRDIVGIPLI